MTAPRPATWKNGSRLVPGPVFAAVVALMLALTAAPTGAQTLYGSIAFSHKSGGGYAGGIAWNHGSLDKARRQAIEKCRGEGGQGCREVGWFRDACGAIAIGDGNGYGTGWGETFGPAEEMAMAKCRGVGNANCRVEISRCAKPDVAFTLTRAQRREVQAALAGQGTSPGPADGVFGPRTRAAVAAWQSSRGYAATGELTEGQVRELLGAPTQAEIETGTKQTAPEEGGDLWGSIAFSRSRTEGMRGP